MISLGHFLSLGGLLFAMSVIGIFLNRKNLILLFRAKKILEQRSIQRYTYII